MSILAIGGTGYLGPGTVRGLLAREQSRGWLSGSEAVRVEGGEVGL
jgi:hypothetical protein